MATKKTEEKLEQPKPLTFEDKVFAKYPAKHHVTFGELREVLQTLSNGPRAFATSEAQEYDEESDAQPD